MKKLYVTPETEILLLSDDEIKTDLIVTSGENPDAENDVVLDFGSMF